MLLDIGEKVVYPSQGPCLIDSIVEKIVAGEPVNFYRLIVLEDTRGELFVPLDKIRQLGIRQLVDKSRVPKLLKRLTKTTEMSKDWKQRARDTTKLLCSGEAFDLAEIVGSLTALSGKKPLSVSESWMLEKAKKLMICEISEVTGNPKTVTEKQVNLALNAHKPDVVEKTPMSLSAIHAV